MKMHVQNMHLEAKVAVMAVIAGVVEVTEIIGAAVHIEVNVTAVVGYGALFCRKAKFVNQVMFNDISDPGDSGSVILESGTLKPVALLSSLAFCCRPKLSVIKNTSSSSNSLSSSRASMTRAVSMTQMFSPT